MIDLISGTTQHLDIITQALLVHTDEHRNYIDVLGMTLLDISDLHYIVESTQTRRKHLRLNKAKQTLFESGKHIIEKILEQKLVALPSGHKGNLKLL